MYSQRMVSQALRPGLLGHWSRTKRLLTPRDAPTFGKRMRGLADRRPI
jgi:hypothetical protein